MPIKSGLTLGESCVEGGRADSRLGGLGFSSPKAYRSSCSADSLGVGRFVKIGIPWPQFMAPFVGVVEIVCGSAVIDRSCYARLEATVPLLIDIAVAILSRPKSSRSRRTDFGERCMKPARM